MRRLTTLICLVVFFSLLASGILAQETYFGKNKVQYRTFDWNYIQTDHFDIYFYDNGINLAEFAAAELEKAYVVVAKQLNYFSSVRLPVFIYNSHNDFQQTNIINQEPSMGTQGFTEAFKKRIVVHFMGSYEEFRHLLHHELTHAVVYDLIYGEFFKAVLNPNRLFQQPLWLAEGYAEYSSNGGWTVRADMMVRDATVQNYMRPPGYMGYLAYTVGFALTKYIADTWGVEKIGEIFHKGKALLTADRALKASIGLTEEELFEKFQKEMRERYWPDIALRQEPGEFAKSLTDHEEDPSHFNEKPVYHPIDEVLAVFTDYNGYTEIHLISAIDGKRIKKLVKGQRSADLEEIRWYTSGMSFSPDGKSMVFVSKSRGVDALKFVTLEDRDVYLTKNFGLMSTISPDWSPDGTRIAFSSISNSQRDLFVYDFETEQLTRLTEDRYDDLDVSWYPDSRRIAFSSDRPHTSDYTIIDSTEFLYGRYNLFVYDLDAREILELPVGPGNNTEPDVSSDGNKIAFASDRNGIENIYVYYIEQDRVIAVTNALTNAKSPSWSGDGDKIAFSTFFKGGYDVYVIKDVEAKGDNGILTPTDFVLGKYDNPAEWARQADDHPLLAATPVDTVRMEETTEAKPALDPDFPGDRWSERMSWVDRNEDSLKTGDSSDSTSADSTASDSTAVDDSGTEAEATIDDDDAFVYIGSRDTVSDSSDTSGLYGPGSDLESGEAYAFEEPVDSVSAEGLDNRLPGGEYRVKSYKTRFTPDFISGGVQYDTFFGFQGQTFFAFSDYLGDHQIYVATDLVNTIDQSNIQVFYLYNKLQVDFNVGLFHTKNYYLDPVDNLFSDRFYGLSFGMSWPRSKFSRLDLNTQTVFIDRKFYDDPDLDNRNVRVTTGALSWIHDTVLWGITGPMKGRRYKATIEGALPLFGSETVNYYAGELDYRQYMPLFKPFTFSFRFAGGFSNGSQRKNYFLGGNTNRIGSVSVGTEVYNVENLYFASVVTPLRGYDYYELVGTRYAVTNLELRFPFIDYFIMRFPLRLGLASITGALFADIGAVWDEGDTSFKGASDGKLMGIKSGFGFGARANLGIFILRYDMAWRTNYKTVEPHTKHYFSLGAEF